LDDTDLGGTDLYLDDLVELIYEEYPDVDRMAGAHNIGSNRDALNDLPQDVIELVRQQIRREYGDVLTLWHGSEDMVDAAIEWRENSSFSIDDFAEFSGRDGCVVEAQVPVERIKFYLPEEDEFVITEGALECEVYTVAEFFGV
jgi:hypothetical protein